MPSMSRRTAMAAIPAIASSCWAPGAGSSETLPLAALRDIAASKGLLFGAAVRSRQLSGTDGLAAALSAQCNVLVAETEMKWAALERVQGSLDFAAADRIVAFARAHGQQLRGHTLVWHEALPAWLPLAVTTGDATVLLVRHITAVCQHFGAQVQHWDVVNEALQPDQGRPDGLRRSLWLERLGPGYLDLAFHTARAAAPHASLVYNDFGLEQDEKWQDVKRAKLLQLLEGFRRRQVPVDGLGIQAHLNAGVPFHAGKFRAFLRAVAQMNFSIHITELDVNDRSLPADVDVRDAAVAGLTQDFLDVALDEPKLEQLLTWGLSDKDSWLSKTPNKMRTDNLPQRSLPLDEELRPKPMFAAVAQAMLRTKMRTTSK